MLGCQLLGRDGQLDRRATRYYVVKKLYAEPLSFDPHTKFIHKRAEGGVLVKNEFIRSNRVH